MTRVLPTGRTPKKAQEAQARLQPIVNSFLFPGSIILQMELVPVKTKLWAVHPIALVTACPILITIAQSLLRLSDPAGPS